jgi:hypothetical protein
MQKKILALVAVLGAGLMWTASAEAKCTLTLKFRNDNPSHTIKVLGAESQVRVNGGTWSKMQFNDATVTTGQTESRSWTTNMSCSGNAKRDFRIKFEDTDNNVVYSDTDKSNIDIHDGQELTFYLKNQ